MLQSSPHPHQFIFPSQNWRTKKTTHTQPSAPSGRFARAPPQKKKPVAREAMNGRRAFGVAAQNVPVPTEFALRHLEPRKTNGAHRAQPGARFRARVSRCFRFV